MTQQQIQRTTEIVLNEINLNGKNHQDYREYFVDNTGDEREWFDNFCKRKIKYLKEDPNSDFVPAEASPLTCDLCNKNRGR